MQFYEVYHIGCYIAFVSVTVVYTITYYIVKYVYKMQISLTFIARLRRKRVSVPISWIHAPCFEHEYTNILQIYSTQSRVLYNIRYGISHLGTIWYVIKRLSFIPSQQQRKEDTFCALELARIEPKPPVPEEQGIPAFSKVCYLLYRYHITIY